MPQNHRAQRLTKLGFIHQHLRVIGRALLPGTQRPAVVWGTKVPRCRDADPGNWTHLEPMNVHGLWVKI